MRDSVPVEEWSSELRGASEVKEAVNSGAVAKASLNRAKVRISILEAKWSNPGQDEVTLTGDGGPKC